MDGVGGPAQPAVKRSASAGTAPPGPPPPSAHAASSLGMAAAAYAARAAASEAAAYVPTEQPYLQCAEMDQVQMPADPRAPFARLPTRQPARLHSCVVFVLSPVCICLN
jgi:hypothetical protein